MADKRPPADPKNAWRGASGHDDSTDGTGTDQDGSFLEFSLDDVDTGSSGSDKKPDTPAPGGEALPFDLNQIDFAFGDDAPGEPAPAAGPPPSPQADTCQVAAFESQDDLVSSASTAATEVDREEFIREHRTQADILVKYGIPGQAVEHLEMIIARYPDTPQVLMMLKDLYLGEGRKAEAAEKCLDLARFYGIHGRDEVAARWEEEARSLSGASAPDLVEAPEEEEIVVEIEEEIAPGDNNPAEEVLGDVQAEVLDIAGQEVLDLGAALDAQPAELEAPPPDAFEQGSALLGQGKVDDAIRCFEQALGEGLKPLESCAGLGRCFRQKGMHDEAISWYRRGLEQPGVETEQTVPLMYALGETYEEKGDLDRALETYTDVFGLNPEYEDIAAKIETLEARLQ